MQKIPEKVEILKRKKTKLHQKPYILRTQIECLECSGGTLEEIAK